MAAVEMPERVSSKAGPVGGCARLCGGCNPAACPLRGSVSGEIGNGFTLEGIGKVPKGVKGRITFNEGIITFYPASQRSGEAAPINKFVSNEKRTSEEICSRCNKPASTCYCPEPSKN